MSWRDWTDAVIVRDLDDLSAGAREHASGLLVRAWHFTPFVVTLRPQGSVIVESSLSIADALEALSYPDVVAVAVVSADRGHVKHWLCVRMEHRLGGPRIESIADFRRTGLFRKSVRYDPSVESIVEGSTLPLARQFDIDAERRD